MVEWMIYAQRKWCQYRSRLDENKCKLKEYTPGSCNREDCPLRVTPTTTDISKGGSDG